MSVFDRPSDLQLSMELAIDHAQYLAREAYSKIANSAHVSFDGTSGSILVCIGPQERKVSPYFMGQVASATNVPMLLQSRLSPATLAMVLTEIYAEEGPRSFLCHRYSFGTESKDDVVRCVTSSAYKRLWDHQILSVVERSIPGGFVAAAPIKRKSTARVAEDGELLPWLFIGDRFSAFYFYGPERKTKAGVFRTGMMVENSEVGHAAFGWSRFYFSAETETVIEWVPSEKQRQRVVHLGTGPEKGLKRFVRDLSSLDQEPPHDFLEAIQKAKKTVYVDVGDPDRNEEMTLTRLRNFGLTKEQAVRSVGAAHDPINNGGVSPFHLYSIVHGVAGAAMEEKFAEDRVTMQRVAGKLLRVHAS